MQYFVMRSNGLRGSGRSECPVKRFKQCLLLLAALVLSAPLYAALPGVTEFKSPPEKLNDAELSALLRERVAAADVIAIGETVHGSSALLGVQTRLLRYLVENHGLRLIVWENPALRSLELARWVAACTGARTPPPIAVLYMPTAADLPLWEWVCEYNRARAQDPILFRGMDIWDRPWEHYARLRTLGAALDLQHHAPRLKQIETTCPAYRALSWSDIDAVMARLHQDGGFAPDKDYQTCRAQLTAVLDSARQAGTERRQKKAAGADDAFELALSASTLLGWLGFYHYEPSDDILSWNERDRAQGRNLMLLMEKHGAARAIVTAHTSHIAHGRSRADWWGYGDLKSGIHFYSAMTRKKVFTLALTAYQAGGTQGNWSLPTAANSLDKKLYDAGHRFAYFPAGAAFLSAQAKWWMQNQNFPGPYESGVEIVPADQFDAFIFVDRSPLDKALPQRPMWRP